MKNFSSHEFSCSKKMKLFFRIFEKGRRGRREKKSLIANEKFTKNCTKFTALYLHSMLMRWVKHLAIIYHFLIHKNPLEILAEKTFHNFTLRISLQHLLLMSLWDFFSLTLFSTCSRVACDEQKIPVMHNKHFQLPCCVLILFW